MQQYYPSVVELFKIVKKKSSHQTKGSNDKLSLSQCEYNLTSGEFRFQNAIFSSWTLRNWNFLNLHFQDKEDIFISSCEKHSRSITQLRCYHFHGEIWWPTDVINMAAGSAAVIYIYIWWSQFCWKKSMKMRPEIWKMCNGVWVGCSKSWICCSLSLFTDQNCLWHTITKCPPEELLYTDWWKE